MALQDRQVLELGGCGVKPPRANHSFASGRNQVRRSVHDGHHEVADFSKGRSVRHFIRSFHGQRRQVAVVKEMDGADSDRLIWRDGFVHSPQNGGVLDLDVRHGAGRFQRGLGNGLVGAASGQVPYLNEEERVCV